MLLLVLLALPACQTESGLALVTRVIDGDTIEIQGGERVRYIGIDTPETYPDPEPYGLEAQAMNQSLVGGRRVRLERDVSERDRYGRLLRYVFVDDLFVNAELVRLGLAWAIDYPPDSRYRHLLEQAEQEARAARRGIWASGS